MQGVIAAFSELDSTFHNLGKTRRTGYDVQVTVNPNGTAHFSGIDGVGDGTRNLTQYAIDRLNGL